MSTSSAVITSVHCHPLCKSEYVRLACQVDLVSVVPGRDALRPLQPDEAAYLYAASGRDPDLVSRIPCGKCTSARSRLRTVPVAPAVDSGNGGARGVGGSAAGGVKYGMARVEQLLRRHAKLLERYSSSTAALNVVVNHCHLQILTLDH